jgi:two-component system sensor histidine kinase/response regulator
MTEEPHPSRIDIPPDHDRSLRLRAVGFYALFASAMRRFLLRGLPRPQRTAPGVSPATSMRPWLISFGIGAIFVVTMTGTAITISRSEYRDAEAKRLQAVAELLAGQVSERMRERTSKVHFGGTSSMGDLVAQWLGSRDAAVHEELTLRLANFYKASNSATAALVLDRHGEVVAAAGEETGVTPELRVAAERALAGNSVEFTKPYPGDGIMHRHLDIVTPLLRSGSPPAGVIVLRLDPSQYLLPALGRWPLAGRSAGSALIDRDGKSLLDLDARAANIPVGAELLKGETIEAHDAAGVALLAVARPVPGTNWLVVAHMDETEAYAAGDRDALWIAGFGCMVVIAWAIGLYLMREHQALQLKRAEAQQQAEKLQALQLLQSIADSSADSIYAKDRDGRYLLFNRAAGRVVGRPPEEVLGKETSDLFPAAQAEIIVAGDQRVIATGKTYSYEDEVDTVDGPVTFLSTKGPLHGPDGEVVGMYGISRDITARLRAETDLRESVELTRAVGNSILDHLAVLDVAGNVIEVNRAWRAFGADPQAPACRALPRCGVGANYLSEMARGDSPCVEPARRCIEAVLAGREPFFTFEYSCGCSGNAQRWFTMEVTPLKTDRGGAVVVYSDVTELKRATAELGKYRDQLEHLVEERTAQLAHSNVALQDSERFVRTLTDNVPAGLAYWDRDLRCRFANRQYRERFGLSAEAIEVVMLHEVLEPELYARLKPAFDQVLAGRRFEYASVVRNSDGSDGHFLVTLIPDMVDGTTEGVFVLASEVTALKNAELQLQQANDDLVVARDRAEAANRAKSAFVANMSHEIRTPMNAIIGFTELLKADSGNAAQTQRLDHIGEAAQHLLAVINDILDLSKIESGKFTLEHTGFSLRDAVARTVMFVDSQAAQKGLALAVDIARVPDALCGDPTRLAQALLNLLGNAVKFTERGRIELRAQVVEETAADLLVRFEVQDTGIGIAADQLPNLFNAFEQADSSTTRRFGGTGLGLALTRHLAQLMGGEADAQSSLGSGSTFWFTARLARATPCGGDDVPQVLSRVRAVPAAAAHASESGPTPAASPAAARVLVVEDNRFNQEVALAVLQRAGLSVELAVDGRQAVAMAQAGTYDLVLMDLQMPVMDGFEATRALRLLPAYQKTPILALTANAFGETRAACMAAGMDDHIAKPVTLQRLHEHLARWLPQVALARPAMAQPAAAGLLDALAGIEGFEPAIGLALTENQGVFFGLLQQFIASHEDGVPGLDSALATGEREQARRMVHTLKGASAAIGARLLQQLASSCELAIGGGEPIEKLRLLAFDIEYELVHFVGALHDRLPAAAVSGEDRRAIGMDAEQLDAAVQTLGSLLASGDYGAQRFHREIAADLLDAFGDAAGTLAEAVRDHDHERALELIEAMKAGPRAAAVAKDL